MSTFSKVFLGSFISSVVFLSLAAFAGGKALEADPQLPEKISAKFSDNVAVKVGGFSTGMPHSKKTVSTEDSWVLSVPSEKLSLKLISADVAIKSSSVKEIKIYAVGKLDKNKADRLLEVESNANELLIAEPKDGAVEDLEIKIEIPVDFNKRLNFASVSGDLTSENLSLDIFNLSTVSGDIALSQMKSNEFKVEMVSGDLKAMSSSFKKIEGASVSGDLEISNLEKANIDISTVSGDVKLHLSAGNSVQYKLKSMSGEIENRFGSDKNAENSVSISSTSGDIKIE